MNKIIASATPRAFAARPAILTAAGKRSYRVYFFPSMLPWHRIQQFHAMATGHAGSVKLPEARRLSAAGASRAHRRAINCLYAHILAAPPPAQGKIFDSLLTFLKTKRCPVALAGPILSALVYYSNTGNKAAQSVCVYLLKTAAFKSDLKTYPTPIAVLSVQKPGIGVVSGGKLQGQLGQAAFQQGVSSQSPLSAAPGASTASPLGSLNLSFGLEADGEKAACMIGAAIVSASIAVAASVGSDGAALPAAGAVYTAAFATGTSICSAMFEPDAPRSGAPDGGYAPSGGSSVPVTGPTDAGTGPTDAGTRPSDAGNGSKSGGVPSPDAGVTPPDTNPPPDDPETDVCSVDDPGPSYEPDGGFEAGDWVGNGGSDSSAGLNYGAIPVSGDPGADVWSSSGGSGVLAPTNGGPGKGDPLDVQTYGAEALNFNRFNSGVFDPTPLAVSMSRSGIAGVTSIGASQKAAALNLGQVLAAARQ
jgi:hypothetical protein